MSSFSEYMKKVFHKEKEELERKKEKIKEINESSLNKYLKKTKTFFEEETTTPSPAPAAAPEEETDDNYLDDNSAEEDTETGMAEEGDETDDYEKDEDEEAVGSSCPIPTKDQSVNVENRQKAIDEFGYGPEKVDEVNDDFWNSKKETFMAQTAEIAKQKVCGNCAAFSLKAAMLKCLDDGIDKSIDENDTWDADVENRGYCEFLDFKCHAKRTCNSWLEGGPLKDATA